GRVTRFRKMASMTQVNCRASVSSGGRASRLWKSGHVPSTMRAQRSPKTPTWTRQAIATSAPRAGSRSYRDSHHSEGPGNRVQSPLERTRVGSPQRFAAELADAIQRGLHCHDLYHALAPGIEGLLADPRARGGGRLLFAGSGDSLFAATAALPALRRWSGRPVQVMTSLDL